MLTRARLLVLAGALLLAACGSDTAPTSRQADVAERGEAVMPFDLDRTTHVFDATDSGGVQTVVADDPGDAAQIALVRSHLREERERFAVGDFGDPAAIHGHDMPGLPELESGFERIDVTYRHLAQGARLTYSTDDPALVAALHQWFEAQVSDHGAHAQQEGYR